MPQLAPNLQATKRQIDRVRIAETVKNRDVKDLVLWISYLLDETDPMPGASDHGRHGRSADRPLPHEPRKWQRQQQERIFEEIRKLTNDIQTVLKVPPEQRTMTVTTARASVRVSTSEPSGRATPRQVERIVSLAVEGWGSVDEMKNALGLEVDIAELDRKQAKQLTRAIRGGR